MHGLFKEIVRFSYSNGIISRVELRYIERLANCYAKSTTLSNGIKRDSLMLTEDFTFLINNIPTFNFLRNPVLKETSIIGVCHEAKFLTFDLFGSSQLVFTSKFPDFCFCIVTERHYSTLQLLLCERSKEIGLILANITCFT